MSITRTKIESTQAKLTAADAMFELDTVLLDGQTLSAFKNAPNSLIDVLEVARNHGDAEFLVYQDERYTFNEFFEKVDAFAATLANEFAISHGDRVAIAMRNCPEWSITFAAVVLTGAIAVPINSWSKTEELEYSITDCGAVLLVCDKERLDLIEECRASLDFRVIATGSDEDIPLAQDVHSFQNVLQHKGQRHQAASPEGEATCMILYTSGSTGYPKGVAIRHVSLGQALMHTMFFGMLGIELDGPVNLGGGATRETMLVTVPLFHATGLIGGLIMPLLTGQKVVMMYKWDVLEALRLIEEEQVTTFGTVPTVLQDLLTHPNFDDFDTSSLRRLGAGGSAAPTSLPELVEKKVPQTIRALGWGMTETISVGAFMTGSLTELAPLSAGLVSPLIDMRFVDDDGRVLPADNIGEIEVRSICCTLGYWGKPEATESIFSEDRWMKTGDLGRLDENGYLHITGRKKEIVIRGGENIYPGEIETFASAIEGVHEVVVFGVPDEKMGEELAMTLYREPGSKVNEEIIRNILGERLAGYKVPRYITISDTPLPQNASGKLYKLKIREAFLNSQG